MPVIRSKKPLREKKQPLLSRQTTPAAKTNDKTTADKNNAKQTNVTVTGDTKADAPLQKR